jgi:hypothetical protein
MWKRLLITLIGIALAAHVMMGTAPRALQAQDGFTADDAIALAAASPEFANGLAITDGWYAQAYFTRNAYNVWHVQFFNANGEDIGEADVSPAIGRVFSAWSYIGPTETQKQQAEPILREFIANHPDVVALLDNPADHIGWFDYDAWNDWWFVYIEQGRDSFIPLVRFDNKHSLDNPTLLGITFEGIVSYDEWHTTEGSQATAIGFGQTEIATALRAHEGWTSSANPVTDGADGLWWVGYYVGDWLVAEATVDVLNASVTSFQVYG